MALSGPWQIQPQNAQRLVSGGTTVVDLSSPPALPHALQEQLGERFVSIDDLAWGPQVEFPGALRTRLGHLVSGSGREYCKWLLARDSLPAIQAMSEAAEGRRRSELEWLLRRLPNLSDEEKALVDQMTPASTLGRGSTISQKGP